MPSQVHIHTPHECLSVPHPTVRHHTFYVAQCRPGCKLIPPAANQQLAGWHNKPPCVLGITAPPVSVPRVQGPAPAGAPGATTYHAAVPRSGRQASLDLHTMLPDSLWLPGASSWIREPPPRPNCVFHMPSSACKHTSTYTDQSQPSPPPPHTITRVVNYLSDFSRRVCEHMTHQPAPAPPAGCLPSEPAAGPHSAGTPRGRPSPGTVHSHAQAPVMLHVT